MVGLKSIMSSSIVFNLFWNQSLLESCLVQSSYGSCNLPPTCTDSVIDLACNIACSLLVHVHLINYLPAATPSIPSPPQHHAHSLVTNLSIFVCPCLESWHLNAMRTMTITSIHPLQYPTTFLNPAFRSSFQTYIPWRFCLIGTYSFPPE